MTKRKDPLLEGLDLDAKRDIRLNLFLTDCESARVNRLAVLYMKESGIDAVKARAHVGKQAIAHGLNELDHRFGLAPLEAIDEYAGLFARKRHHRARRRRS